jgi:cellulose synthase operon protein C
MGIATAAPNDLDPVFAQIEASYDSGQYFQAYQQACLTDLTQPDRASVMILAGKIANQVGAPRLARWLHLKAGRQFPTSAPAAYRYAQALLHSQGLLKTWQFTQNWVLPHDITPRQTAEWWALQAHLLGHWRDFDAADRLITQAQVFDPDNPWLGVEQAWLLAQQDRLDEALVVVETSLQLQPWHRSAIAMAAHLHDRLGQPDRAYKYLEASQNHLESGALVLQLAHRQKDQQDYDRAAQSYDRYEMLMPLLERRERECLAAWRSDVAYGQGDLAQTRFWAKQVPGAFYQALVDRLAENPVPERVLLPVKFVAQHHMTCVPATLAMLSQFWGMPIAQETIARAIDPAGEQAGISAQQQRHWAEQQGWLVREFTVTWESAMALIDRGLPFSVSTIDVSSAHLRAVVGYDKTLQQLLLRDPQQPNLAPVWATTFFVTYAATGPRGMVMVPADRADLLEELDLPDAGLYDQTLVTLVEEAPDHYITLQAQRHDYVQAIRSGQGGDEAISALLLVLDRLLELFPDQPLFLQDKLCCWQNHDDRTPSLALLAKICAKPDCPPFFWQAYAIELGQTNPKAIHLLHRSIRHLPHIPQNYAILGDILWLQGDRQNAVNLYRIAACLDNRSTRYACTYFLTASQIGQTAIGLEFMQQRWERWGDRSSEPGLTLFWAYQEAGQLDQAFMALDRACERRPDDQGLRLAAAQNYREYGDKAWQSTVV